MTLHDLTARLQTHTPSLLPEAEWPMSKGPLEVYYQQLNPDQREFEILINDSWTGIYCAMRSDNGIASTQDALLNEANARYIAALSPDDVIPGDWEEYNALMRDYAAHNHFPVRPELAEGYLQRALRLLARLDKMGVIRWIEKTCYCGSAMGKGDACSHSTCKEMPKDESP